MFATNERGRSQPPLQTESASEVLREPQRTVAIAAVLAAMVLAVLDAAIANLALPTMAQSRQAFRCSLLRPCCAHSRLHCRGSSRHALFRGSVWRQSWRSALPCCACGASAPARGRYRLERLGCRPHFRG